MPLRPPILDDRTFDSLVNEAARAGAGSSTPHELTHVVQQAASTREGRRLLARRLRGIDPVLWFALTSDEPLTERQLQQMAQQMIQQTPPQTPPQR
jgi:hypothetical protein